MTEQTHDTAVSAIIEKAHTTVNPTHLLDKAARLTGKNSTWKGRRKLSDQEAYAATRVVTEMVHRYGLKPTTVLQRDGRASGPEQTSRFYLSDAQMKTGKIGSRSYAKGIGAHVENVRSIATAACTNGHEVDEGLLLGELAEAVESFLDQFRDTVQDPDVELSEDIARMGPWLAKPGRRFELVRCLAEARRLDLDFDPATGTMSHVGRDVSDYAYDVMPWVPLRTRAVAEADCIVSVRDEAERLQEAAAMAEDKVCFFLKPKLEEISRERAVVCEKVGLGVMLDGGRGLRLTLTVDHVVYAGTSFRDEDGRGSGLAAYLECRGIPELGEGRLATDDVHYLTVVAPMKAWCPDFRAYAEAALAGFGSRDAAEAIFGRRLMPVTPENCRMLLDGGDRDPFMPWRYFSDIKEESVLPSSAINDEGCETWLVRDRFAEALYDPGKAGLTALLEAESEKRAKAFEAYQIASESGVRRRKLEFRARMRG